uniref:Uncharacterized protein n=1 Tax=Avena sativa TaxID=4498 RepID=A0ACD5UMP9_AVESA
MSGRAPSCAGRQGLMVRALAAHCTALQSDIAVSEHFPEPFLARFIHQHHCHEAVTSHDFLFEGLKVQVRPWRLEDHAEQVDMQHHVRLCIENVPLWAWNEQVAQQVIGSACSLHYIEPACGRKEFTKALCVWAWTASPGLVPHVNWVMLPGRNGIAGRPARGRKGLQRRCLIHLDIDEDLSGPEDAPSPPPGAYTWRYGIVDGERVMRDRTERITGGDRGHGGCRDDDDSSDRDRSGRQGRDASRSWRDTIRRSLSRPARNRGCDEDRRQEQGRDRDRSGNRLRAGLVLEGCIPVRGRSRARSASPGSSRRLSRAARSPPVTPDPPSSPTAICPSSPIAEVGRPLLLLMNSSSGCGSHVSLSPAAGVVSVEARRALEILAPSMLLSASSCPHSFGKGSPSSQATPAFVSAFPDTRTPPSGGSLSGSTAASGGGAALMAPLFSASQQPLLSPPPVHPTNRRKTLAGVAICRSVNYSLRRASARIKARRKATPVAKAAEAAVCRSLESSEIVRRSPSGQWRSSQSASVVKCQRKCS